MHEFTRAPAFRMASGRRQFGVEGFTNLGIDYAGSGSGRRRLLLPAPPIRSSHSCSVRVVTPSSRALAALEPASAPTTR